MIKGTYIEPHFHGAQAHYNCKGPSLFEGYKNLQGFIKSRKLQHAT